MQEVNYPTPNCPVELFKLNEVQRELESPMAFAELVSDAQDDFDPTPSQGLNAAIMIVSQLQKYHFDTINNGDLDEWQMELWSTDYELLKKAIGLLRQVTQD